MEELPPISRASMAIPRSPRSSMFECYMVKRGMPIFQVETPQRCYTAIVERGVIGQASQYIPPKTGKVFVVTTEDVWRHAGAQLVAGLAGVSYDVLHLPGGEE